LGGLGIGDLGHAGHESVNQVQGGTYGLG
jgi:hypothetical protein